MRVKASINFGSQWRKKLEILRVLKPKSKPADLTSYFILNPIRQPEGYILIFLQVSNFLSQCSLVSVRILSLGLENNILIVIRHTPRSDLSQKHKTLTEITTPKTPPNSIHKFTEISLISRNEIIFRMKKNLT